MKSTQIRYQLLQPTHPKDEPDFLENLETLINEIFLILNYGRNINVSFTNNSNVPIEVMIFIFYSDEIAIDVKTGLVTRHKN
jgi:hypothetical protein